MSNATALLETARILSEQIKIWSMFSFAHLLLVPLFAYSVGVVMMRQQMPLKAHGTIFLLFKLFSIFCIYIYLSWYPILRVYIDRASTGLTTAVVPLLLIIYMYPTILRSWNILCIVKLNSKRVELSNYIPNHFCSTEIIISDEKKNQVATPVTPQEIPSNSIAFPKKDKQEEANKKQMRLKIRKQIKLIKYFLSNLFQCSVISALILIQFIFVVPCIICGLIAILLENKALSDNITIFALFCCAISVVCFIILFLVFVILAKKFHVKESYGIVVGIVLNILLMSIESIVLVLQVTALMIVSGSLPRIFVSWVGECILLLLLQVDAFCTVGIPLLRTLFKKKKQTTPSEKKNHLLYYVMEEKELRNGFEQYVKREWALENMLFLRRFKMWNKIYEQPTVLDNKILFLEELREDFLDAEESPFALNLPSTFYENITKAIEKRDYDKAHEILGQITKQIELLMMDTLFRYCSSNSIFKQHVSQKRVLDQSFTDLKW